MKVIQPGQLAPVPRFRALMATIPQGPGRDLYLSIHKTMEDLGRAVLVGQQRCLIEFLSSSMGYETLVAMTEVSIDDPEACSAFSVYLTTLEQAYHWPRECSLSTPKELENHKFVIQMLQQPELQDILLCSVDARNLQSVVPSRLARSALTIAKAMIDEASLAQSHGLDFPRERQDLVNLLYRTSRGDWFIQGDYRDPESHLEFGRLHEVTRTNGTQRSVQEIFECFSGLSWLQRIPILHRNLHSTSEILCTAYTDLQVAMAMARDELFSMVIDEPVWGLTFAKVSKGVGFCTIGAGGADCPMFRMMDALCGRVDNVNQAALLEELDFRSRFFPPTIRALINDLATAPSIRHFINSGEANYELAQAFKAMEQIRYDLYEMHRKKAMRIALALRAGQQATSSGTQNASSPEKHIAMTLSAAIDVRFGQDATNPQVNAFAWSSPLLRSEGGQVQAARIQLVFSTPLAVSPGDSLNIAVEVKQGEWHVRTYSITHAFARRKTSKTKGQVCQAVGSVEICVRNKGEVSSFLCNQETGFPVRVMIKPAPHFRIAGNSSPDEQTLFIAQGGAVGVFLAWLSWQDQLVGNYKLIVGARDYNMLAYASQLQKISSSFSDHLKVLVALSKPAPGDIQKLLSGKLKAFTGRVTTHLDFALSNNPTTTYVCGSSSFALGVVHCLSQSITRTEVATPSRLRPIVTSRLPNLRLHVAASVEGPLDKPPLLPITKAELALHNSPGDLWIALGDMVYDITAVPCFHPGGEKVLIYRAGRQGLDVFETVHDGCYMTNSLLNEMVIGRLVSSGEGFQEWEDLLDKIVEIQNDLTNHSRFEQTPTGYSCQLSQSPPVEVLRASMDCFTKGWASLLNRVGADDMEGCRLRSTYEKTNSTLHTHLRQVYDMDFDNVHRYAEALRKVFDAHALTTGKIHGVIDEIKRHIVDCLYQRKQPQLSILDNSTASIVLSMEETVKYY